MREGAVDFFEKPHVDVSDAAEKIPDIRSLGQWPALCGLPPGHLAHLSVIPT
jgi:hypothetical protein